MSHDRREMDFGDARVPRRIWNRIQRTDEGHWLWTGAVSGHPQVRITTGPSRYRTVNVRRFFLEEGQRPVAIGRRFILVEEGQRPIAIGGCLRACVNPAHLREFKSAVQAAQAWQDKNPPPTHCPRGHAYSADNVYEIARGEQRTRRLCRTCQLANMRQVHRRRRLRQLRTMLPARRQQAVRRAVSLGKAWETRRIKYGATGCRDRDQIRAAAT